MSIRYLLILLVLILFFIDPLSADNPTVMVTGYSIAPDVVMPGDTATITVSLANTANQASKTASSSIGTGSQASQSDSVTVPVNAFIESATLKTSDFQIINGWYESIGEIGPGQSANLTFFVKAPAASGLYFPEIWIRIRNSESVKYPVPVNVNSPYALLKQPSLKVTRSVPEQVSPGSLFDLGVEIENEGQSAAHDLIVTVNTQDHSISSLSSEQFFIRALSPGEKRNLNLSFETDKNIPLGISQFPVTINYLSADGTKRSQTAQIGVRIQGKGELGISKYQITPQQPGVGDVISLIVRIENTGTDDAKSVRASVNIPFSGMKDAFIGTIEPNNDAPAVFNLKATKSGDIPYTLKVTFHDDYGDHEISQPLSLSVDEKNGSWVYLIILLLILSGAGLYLYKRRSAV